MSKETLLGWGFLLLSVGMSYLIQSLGSFALITSLLFVGIGFAFFIAGQGQSAHRGTETAMEWLNPIEWSSLAYGKMGHWGFVIFAFLVLGSTWLIWMRGVKLFELRNPDFAQWYAVIVESDFVDPADVTVTRHPGELYSTGTVLADPMPEHFKVKKLDHKPDFAKEMWDATTESFKPRPPEPPRVDGSPEPLPPIKTEDLHISISLPQHVTVVRQNPPGRDRATNNDPVNFWMIQFSRMLITNRSNQRRNLMFDLRCYRTNRNKEIIPISIPERQSSDDLFKIDYMIGDRVVIKYFKTPVVLESQESVEGTLGLLYFQSGPFDLIPVVGSSPDAELVVTDILSDKKQVFSVTELSGFKKQ